jgi:RNA polymerase sigma factor (sigma-70 family)
VTDELPLRELTPAVIGVLVRRGIDFAAAEDAVQDALLQATLSWPEQQPADPRGWLVTVAWRKFLDAHRSEASRRDRERRVEFEPPPGPTETADDTLRLFFLCAHPSLTPAAAVALTLRAVGGLTTRQIAQAYLVPEATMAQRISRAKRTVRDVRFTEPGDLATVLRVLYLVFNEGYTGDVDLVAEAIRLTRQVASTTGPADAPEAAGLLALMLLHHARRPARTLGDGSLVPLAEQDRSRWDTALIAEGVSILQGALSRDRLGEFQAQAAMAALHADAARAEETDWVQIVGWYDELLRITGSPVVQLNRAVAVGEADGAEAGLAAFALVDPGLPRYAAASAYLHEKAGDLPTAARLYAAAAGAAQNLAERQHLTLQAARIGLTGPVSEESRVASATRNVMAPADVVFELIADPAQQPWWDGNDNLAEAQAGQRVHAVGDVFTMAITQGAVRENHVVEFDEGRLIAWRPSEPGGTPPGHLWRWELEALADGRTRVTHTYDWSQLTDEKRQVRARATTADKLQLSVDRLAALAEKG